MTVTGVLSLRSAAALVVAGTILSGPIAMVIVALVGHQPPWYDIATYRTYYHPIESLPYLLGYILLTGFVLFTSACHSSAGRSEKGLTTPAIIATAIYASMIFVNYTIQIGYVPRMLSLQAPYTHSTDQLLSALTMANPTSFAWFLEMFGYAAMGVATWLVAPLFGGSRRGRTIKYLLTGNGVMSIVGAACTAVVDGFVFTDAGFVSFVAWNAVVIVCFALIAATPGGGMIPLPDDSVSSSEQGK